ncbi:MAG: mechanosensitive ion channel protein [Porticoccaceae bacterium]|jgi:small conductance mechanosensitive channel|nr:mechanosensitive ion channel protein [Porticoccaceae bacterium]
MSDLVDRFATLAMIYGAKIVSALIIFLVGKWLARKLSQLLLGVMEKRDLDPALRHFSSSLVYYGLLALVVISALGQLGIQTASLAAVIAAAGLAIGLAMQGSLSNFAAGFLLLVFRPFRIGDYVELAGTAGTVEKILIFTTELKSLDNKKVIIPNSAITSATIVNYSANPTRRLDLVIGISYDDDIDRARDAIRAVLDADDRVLADPAPFVAVSALADSSVNFVVRPWAKSADYWALYCDLTENIKKRFDAEGITIPYPQRDVHLHQAGAAGGAA